MAEEFETAAALGAGVIGASWTALFLAAGVAVRVHDPDPGAERRVRDYVARAWETLGRLDMTDRGDPEKVTFHADPARAVEGAQFVQESVPERIGIKRELFARIEPALEDGATVASSASGLMLSELQEGWGDPSRLVLGHPFNPPHLIPLVEVLGNERTAEDVVVKAERFYANAGKVTIRLRREVPAHVANRLQAALWREAIHLARSGVASVEDIDKAVWAGPGLRWAAMGPHMLFHLAAGEGGMGEFCRRYADSFRRWWDDLGEAKLDEHEVRLLEGGVAEEAAGRGLEELAESRDEMLVEMLRAAGKLRRGDSAHRGED